MNSAKDPFNFNEIPVLLIEKKKFKNSKNFLLFFANFYLCFERLDKIMFWMF